MATPGQLVKCIAEALEIPEPTVVQYDRLLAENGMRSKGGRGTSAAKVTSGDAANLLIAILGSPVAGASIKPAIEVCKAYGRILTATGSGRSDNLKTFRRLGFSTLGKLPASHSLRDGLVAVIEGAKVGESLIYQPKPDDPPLTGPVNDFLVNITLAGPNQWAEIKASYMPSREAALIYFDRKPDRAPWWSANDSGDLYQSRFITFKTIRQIGELLAGASK
jgi:hypothetical protein